jgi:hypothetical protein
VLPIQANVETLALNSASLASLNALFSSSNRFDDTLQYPYNLQGVIISTKHVGTYANSMQLILYIHLTKMKRLEVQRLMEKELR